MARHEGAHQADVPLSPRHLATETSCSVTMAFRAHSWKEVDDFYASALANGGVCDGAPGLRLHYGPDFYAAYVRDPDGNKVAAVCRGITDAG
jgi:predicted lactoylglutathione lyase